MGAEFISSLCPLSFETEESLVASLVRQMINCVITQHDSYLRLLLIALSLPPFLSFARGCRSVPFAAHPPLLPSRDALSLQRLSRMPVPV